MSTGEEFFVNAHSNIESKSNFDKGPSNLGSVVKTIHNGIHGSYLVQGYRALPQNNDIQNRNIPNKDIQNEDIQNEDVQNDDIQNKDIQNNFI